MNMPTHPRQPRSRIFGVRIRTAMVLSAVGLAASTLVAHSARAALALGAQSPSTAFADVAEPGATTCLPLCTQGRQDPYVDCVVSFNPAPETAYHTETTQVTDPETGEVQTQVKEYFGWNHDKLPVIVLGPPKGVFDTLSLGCGGSLTVGFVDPPLIDGPGPDLIAFENAFSTLFPEPFEVEISDDGCTWFKFPCNPVTLEGCGGVSVVKALPGTGIDPTDPTVAGGDAFDLADLGVSRARFVRVTSVSRQYWEPRGQGDDWCDPGPLTAGKGGSDIDAFALVHTPTAMTPAPALPALWQALLGLVLLLVPFACPRRL